MAIAVTGAAQAEIDLQTVKVVSAATVLSTATGLIMKCSKEKDVFKAVNMDVAAAYMLSQLDYQPALYLSPAQVGLLIVRAAAEGVDDVKNTPNVSCEDTKRQLGPNGNEIPGLWKTDDDN
jgi:hypothetical protein